jgi:hypothetical protein
MKNGLGSVSKRPCQRDRFLFDFIHIYANTVIGEMRIKLMQVLVVYSSALTLTDAFLSIGISTL